MMSKQDKGHRVDPRSMIANENFREGWEAIFNNSRDRIEESMEAGRVGESDGTSEGKQE